VTCAFDLGHYRELLEAARAGGYRFALFDHEPVAGDLFLRHDVDLSLEAAVTMAELEAEAGARATYFLMTRSVFYNLASPAGQRVPALLRELGHGVGLHAVWPDAARDARFDAVVAWHNPDPDYMSRPLDGAVNVMQPPWFTQGLYRSDSNQHWRSGCPHEPLARADLPWLQLLTHPEIWVYRGDTMRQSMESMLHAKREDWLRYLEDDRIDLS
jgi:hypothetical protein